MVEADEDVEKHFEAEKALEKYLEILSLDSLNYEALWKVSHVYRILGEHLPITTDEQKEKKLRRFQEAARYADQAVAVKPQGAEAYVQRAAANSHLAMFKNIWKFSSLMNDVRDDCQKAIELDPRNAEAYHLFGRAHLKLSERMKLFRWLFGVSWGNKEDAIWNLEKAIQLQPEVSVYHFELARAYFAKKKYDKAQDHLSIVLSLASRNGQEEYLRKEASDLLETIKRRTKE